MAVEGFFIGFLNKISISFALCLPTSKTMVIMYIDVGVKRYRILNSILILNQGEKKPMARHV